MNKFYLDVNSTRGNVSYFVVDLIFLKLNAGRLVKSFSTYDDARLFWNDQHQKFIALRVVHNATVII